MDQIRFFQFIQNSRNGLAAGAYQIGDVLLGEAVFYERFVTYLAAMFAGAFFQKLHDSGAYVLQNERFPVALCPAQTVAQVEHDGLCQAEILLHEVFEILHFDG